MDSVKWGYILNGPGRPDRDTQRRVMHHAGADMSATGTVWEDKLPARATRPQSALVERNLLLGSVGSGDVVHVASLLCIGASGADAAWFAREAGRRGAVLVVHEGMREIAPGDDLEGLETDFNRARNTMHVARSRAKARKNSNV